VALVGQGLTLPLVTRWLRLGGDGLDGQEEMRARSLAADAAVARIEQLAKEWPGHLPLIDTLRSQYQHRATHLADVRAGTASEDGIDPSTDAEQELLEHRLMRRAVIDAERAAVLPCATMGRSAMRCGGGWSATWTWKNSAWRPEDRAPARA